jgi:hypothetical protein
VIGSEPRKLQQNEAETRKGVTEKEESAQSTRAISKKGEA